MTAAGRALHSGFLAAGNARPTPVGAHPVRDAFDPVEKRSPYPLIAHWVRSYSSRLA
jgi:hypothetical protein